MPDVSLQSPRDRDELAARLALYRRISRIGWPRTYEGKLVLLALLAFLPLLALVAVVSVAPLPAAPRWVVPAAALVAVALALAAFRRTLRSLLAPVQLSREALLRYLSSGELGMLPSTFGDELGLLMRDVDATIERFDEYRRLLEQYAAFDLLTGLLNRRAAEDRLRQTLSLTQRNPQPVVVAMLDLDHFKEINDRHGHAAGDRLLAAVAAQLRASVRGADWAARWGGEEFLLVLHTDRAGALAALERLRLAVAAVTITYAGAEFRCSVSAGAACAAAEESPGSVVHRADVALYEAKHAGRDRVRIAP